MKRLVTAIALGALALVAMVWMLNLRGEDGLRDGPEAAAPTVEQVARGAYLARVGNCMTCHTDRGGAAYAGGRAIETPFGAVYSSNLTPDAQTGLGSWSSGHFWRALHRLGAGLGFGRGAAKEGVQAPAKTSFRLRHTATPTRASSSAARES